MSDNGWFYFGCPWCLVANSEVITFLALPEDNNKPARAVIIQQHSIVETTHMTHNKHKENKQITNEPMDNSQPIEEEQTVLMVDGGHHSSPWAPW